MCVATTISPGLAGAIAGALMGAIFGGLLRFVLDRRSEHQTARSVARLIYLELEEIWMFLGQTIDEGAPWEGHDFSVPTWTEHRQVIAGELADDELKALMAGVRWLPAVNRWRRDWIDRRSRDESLTFSDKDNQFLGIVVGSVDIARQAIAPLQRGRRWFMFRPRVPESLPKDLSAPCSCGHPWGQHHWHVQRRWLRLRRPRVAYQDFAHGCKACDCQQFELDEPTGWRRRLRLLRLLPQAPKTRAAPGEPTEDALYFRNRAN